MERNAFLILSACAMAVAAEAEETPALTKKEIAESNNPLSNLNAFDFQNYYVPSIYGLPDKTANTMNLRGIQVSGRHIIRGTMPVVSQPNAAGVDRSGLGDFSVFDAIKLTPDGAPLEFAVGPLLVESAAVVEPLSGGFALTSGYSIRSSPVMVFDFRNDRYLIPWGLGFGKVFKAGPLMANAFIEPLGVYLP